MRIRIVNENDWEKNYDLDRSIIRIGSQVSCNIQLRDASIPPLLMQIIRINDADIRNVIRFFAPNIMIIRGNQTFPADVNNPYDILDGDQFSFGKYRMFITMGSDKTRIRTSKHMRAEMFFSKRELSPESTINGVIELKNLGTEKPCQFRMQISGIPKECLQFSPLPYLYPGASSSVGFIISHLRTKPAPGFTTVSITISAPDEYFGEELEFNQDIYVAPVFDNDFVLEDDSRSLTGFNKGQEPKLKEIEPEKIPLPLQEIPDTMRLDSSAEIEKTAEPSIAPVRILGSNDTEKDLFTEPEEENDTPYTRKKKREPIVVIRHGDDDAFDSGTGIPVSDKTKETVAAEPQKVSKMTRTRVKKSDIVLPKVDEPAAEPDKKSEPDDKFEFDKKPVPDEKFELDKKPEPDEKLEFDKKSEPEEKLEFDKKSEPDGKLELDKKPESEEKFEFDKKSESEEKFELDEKPESYEKLESDEKAVVVPVENKEEVEQHDEVQEDELKMDGKAKVVTAEQITAAWKMPEQEEESAAQQTVEEKKPDVNETSDAEREIADKSETSEEKQTVKPVLFFSSDQFDMEPDSDEQQLDRSTELSVKREPEKRAFEDEDEQEMTTLQAIRNKLIWEEDTSDSDENSHWAPSKEPDEEAIPENVESPAETGSGREETLSESFEQEKTLKVDESSSEELPEPEQVPDTEAPDQTEKSPEETESALPEPEKMTQGKLMTISDAVLAPDSQPETAAPEQEEIVQETIPAAEKVETPQSGTVVKKKTEKNRSGKKPLVLGNTPVYVVSGSDRFDEFFDSTPVAEASPEEDSGNKPKIRVMKGGGFDE